MQFLTATRLLFTAHLSRAFFSKRMVICFGLVCTPIATALMIAWRASLGTREIPVEVLEVAGWCQVQIIVPLIALIMGSAAVAEEVEERTITYLFTRPIPRPCILIGRGAAILIAVSLLLGGSAWTTHAILASCPNEMTPEQLSATGLRLLETVLMGGVVYSTVFAAAGAWFRRPIIVGLGYSFAVEGLFANLPGANGGLAIQFYLKSYLLAGDSVLRREIEESRLLDLVPPDDAVRTLVWVTLAAILLGSFMITRRQYELPS